MLLFANIASVSGRPGPERALVFHCQFKWRGDPAFIVGLTGLLQYQNRFLCSHVVCDEMRWPEGGYRALMERNSEILGNMIAPLTSDAISFIERHRTDDVNVSLTFRYQYQLALQSSNEKGHPTLLVGSTNWDFGLQGFSISQSEWLKRLKEMEWTEFEIFEIPTLPLNEDKNLAEAFQLLRDAHGALRNHDHKGVLVKCREALESAAKYEAQGDTRKGFELLLSRAFPEHRAKCDTMNSLIHKFSDYAHTLGRHAQYPALHVTRSEAEFALATSMALFSLLGRRLSGVETIK